MPDDLLGTVFDQLLALNHESQAVEALAKLAPRWQVLGEALGKSELEMLTSVLRQFAAAGREQCLGTVSALAPLIADQGGEPALQPKNGSC